MAQEKINARCRPDIKDSELARQMAEFMQDRKYKTLFAQLCALQYLIAKSRNPKGEWVKDITYKRHVRTENAVLMRFRRLICGGHSRDSILGYDVELPRVFH